MLTFDCLSLSAPPPPIVLMIGFTIEDRQVLPELVFLVVERVIVGSHFATSTISSDRQQNNRCPRFKFAFANGLPE